MFPNKFDKLNIRESDNLDNINKLIEEAENDAKNRIKIAEDTAKKAIENLKKNKIVEKSTKNFKKYIEKSNYNLDTIEKRKNFIDQLFKKDPIVDRILFNICYNEIDDDQLNDIIFPPIFTVENIDKSYENIFLDVFLIYKIKNDPSENNLFDFENNEHINEDKNLNFFDYPFEKLTLHIEYNIEFDTFKITHILYIDVLQWEINELIKNTKEIKFKGLVEETTINLKKINFEDLNKFNQKILKNSNYYSFIDSLNEKKPFFDYYLKDSGKDIWGPVTWRALHMLTFNIKDDKFKEKQKELFDIIIKICASLPCQKCAFHASHLIKKYKIENMNEKKKLILYMFNLHNSVNKRNNKKKISYNEFINIYNNLSFKDTIQEFYLHLWKTFSTVPFLRLKLINQFKKFISNNKDCYYIT